MSDKAPKVTSAINEAQSILEAAQQRADEIIASAKDAKKESHQKGFEQGYQLGLDEGRKEALRTAVRMLEETGALGENLASQVAKLAFAIARSIVGEHVKADSDAVLHMARKAVQESIVGHEATLVVNPSDEEVILEISQELRRIAGGAGIIVETDPSISRGGCIVRSDFGEVDARVESLLEVIAARLGLTVLDTSDDSATNIEN